MSSERQQQIVELYLRALEQLPGGQAAFLDRACAGDEALRREVESLIAADERTGNFLAAPGAKFAAGLPAETRESSMTGRRLGRYQVVSLLGAGGMGEVYLAQDPELGRRVALKLLPARFTADPDRVRRFAQEARAASALNHPNIITIYEIGHFGGTHFIATEYVAGRTLREQLDERRLTDSQLIEVAIQVAGALQAAHAAGVVHRDIKPENIMLRPDGYVKVLDFGLAKLAEDPAPAADSPLSTQARPATEPGLVVGTTRYMSPEQARGQKVDGRSDIFSLGVVLYEMAAGRPPFLGHTHGALIAALLTEEPPPLDSTPAGLGRVIGRALQKDRAGRYQDAGELLADLRRQRQELDVAAAPAARRVTGGAARPGSDASTRIISGERLPRGRRLALTLLAVAIVAAAYLAFRWWPARAPTAPGPRSLAVLPFRNLRPDPATDFLGLSLADAVITKLSYVNALSVRPSSYVGKFRNQEVDPQKVADELSVGTLLMGSFLHDGDDLWITVELIDVGAKEMLWREEIRLKYDKLITVQDHVAQQIIKGLQLSPTPAEDRQLKLDRPRDSLAYEYYLRGVDFYSVSRFRTAIEMFEKSVARDPNYALAWAHLGTAYTANASLHFGGREDYQQAQAAYDKALTLNPEQIEARIFMANLFTDTGRVEQAVPLLRGVLQANPNIAQAHWELGYAYRFAGALEESIAEGERAHKIDPEVKAHSSVLNSYFYAGQYERFVKSLPADGGSAFLSFYRGLGHYYLKNWTHAAADFDRAYELDPTLLQAQIGKALSHALAGQSRQGLGLLRETERRVKERRVRDAEGVYKIAQAYAALGDRGAALRVLRLSVEGGFFCYPYIAGDPLLEVLRGEPEYALLTEAARRRHEGFMRRFF